MSAWRPAIEAFQATFRIESGIVRLLEARIRRSTTKSLSDVLVVFESLPRGHTWQLEAILAWRGMTAHRSPRE